MEENIVIDTVKEIPKFFSGTVIFKDSGLKEWYSNGKLHRIGGPAVEGVDGYKEWRQYDMLHRIDGPAVEWANGDKEWWLNGIMYYLEADYKRELIRRKRELIRKGIIKNPSLSDVMDAI